MSQAWALPDVDIDEEELNEYQPGRKDALIIAIEATDSMLSWVPRCGEQPNPSESSCCLLETIKVAYQLMKQKIISSPKDCLGLMVFNTESGSVTGQNTWSACNFLLDLQPVSAPSIKKIRALIEKCERDPKEIKRMFTPQKKEPNQIAEALTACLNRFTERLPGEASKRIFWVTDNTCPLSKSNEQHKKKITTCLTKSNYLRDVNITLHFFFNQVSTPFEPDDFYSTLRDANTPEEKMTDSSAPAMSLFPLNLDMSAYFERVLQDASTRENHKRSAFKIPFKIGAGLEIGLNGYVLIVEEKRKASVLVDPNTSCNDQVKVVTEYIDADSTALVEKKDIVNYFPIGDTKETKTFRRVIFTNEEIEKMRTVGLDKGLILLGFRPRDELLWKHHIKHSYFIYPDEDTYVGSIRTFSALLHSMAKKQKIGYGLLRTRKNDSPVLVAILPQLENFDEEVHKQIEPPGMHLCILPWADDLNPPPAAKLSNHLDCVEPGESSNQITQLAAQIVRKLKLRYSPNNIRNPALQYHYDFLAAKYLNEKFEPAEDQSLPRYPDIRERCGSLIKDLRVLIDLDPRAAESVVPSTFMAKKRRRVEDGEGVEVEVVESAFASRREVTLTVQQLKEYLIFMKELPLTGKAPLKAGLIEMARNFLVKNGKPTGSGSSKSTGKSARKAW
ncbi:hypothetical protein PCASD_04379 [Puccinia coronata f. sp. avenae]|uniref:ATP-dependent DNA helicase II subunit 1 n=1 Tax=Puccinia coronata f. sp. avenae TaxID=200324 RepID=A0A2N5VBR8_9BASI|nr:hypothetical protein PCASD_04379 [Puccinia coronata f. sp. avenae]